MGNKMAQEIGCFVSAMALTLFAFYTYPKMSDIERVHTGLLIYGCVQIGSLRRSTK